MDSSKTMRPAGLRTREPLGRCKPGQLAAGGKGDMIDLGEIVIFAGEPEDGGVGMACDSGLARAGDRRGGFERGIRADRRTSPLAGR